MPVWTLLQPLIPSISAVGFCLVIAGHTVPEIWGIQLIKRKLQLYEDSVPVQVPQQTVDLCQVVLDDIQLQPEQEANVTFFQTSTPRIVSRGAVHNIVGGIVGLPVSFNRRDEVTENTRHGGGIGETMRYEQGYSNGEKNTVESHSDGRYKRTNDVQTSGGCNANGDGQNSNGVYDILARRTVGYHQSDPIRRSIILLNDNAIKFAIARDLYGLTTYHVWVENFTAISLFLSGYAAGHTLRKFGGLKQWARMTAYNFIGLTAVMSYFVFVGHYHKNRARRVDKMAAALGDGYADGAIEFYEELTEFEKRGSGREKSVVLTFIAWKESLSTVPADRRLKRLKECVEHHNST